MVIAIARAGHWGVTAVGTIALIISATVMVWPRTNSCKMTYMRPVYSVVPVQNDSAASLKVSAFVLMRKYSQNGGM
jgi:hypothetical protein